MNNQPDLNTIHDKILQIKILLNDLQNDAQGIPAISKNSKRALASLKMLELNISDIVELGLHD